MFSRSTLSVVFPVTFLALGGCASAHEDAAVADDRADLSDSDVLFECVGEIGLETRPTRIAVKVDGAMNVSATMGDVTSQSRLAGAENYFDDIDRSDILVLSAGTFHVSIGALQSQRPWLVGLVDGQDLDASCEDAVALNTALREKLVAATAASRAASKPFVPGDCTGSDGTFSWFFWDETKWQVRPGLDGESAVIEGVAGGYQTFLFIATAAATGPGATFAGEGRLVYERLTTLSVVPAAHDPSRYSLAIPGQDLSGYTCDKIDAAAVTSILSTY